MALSKLNLGIGGDYTRRVGKGTKAFKTEIVEARLISDVTNFIQQKKVQYSIETIQEQQAKGRFPDKFVSYVGSVAKRNEYQNPQQFFKTQLASPRLYARTFTFTHNETGSNEDILKAYKRALQIIEQQASFYVKTGLYKKSFESYIGGKLPKRPLTNDKQVIEGGPDISLYITSLLSYSSTLERHAVYQRTQVGGILYYAAQRIRREFKNLVVNYNYYKADYWGAPHKYDVPVLEIGRAPRTVPKIRKPGKNFRKLGPSVLKRKRGANGRYTK